MARDINKLTSAYTLTALSVDRCLATYPDLRRLRTLCAGKVICITIWILSFLAAIPYTVYAQTDRYIIVLPFAVLIGVNYSGYGFTTHTDFATDGRERSVGSSEREVWSQ